MLRFIGFLILFGLLHNDLTAQISKTSPDKFSYVLGDISYRSDAVFMGRRDSIEAPYIFPSIGYYDKSGFFANASASYLVQKEEQRVDLFLLTAGYIYNKNSFTAGVSGTKYFFNDESYNVQSEIDADLTLLLNYDFKAAEATLIGSSYFGSGATDLAVTFLLDRTFYALDNKLHINPSIGISGGTQYFYEEYYNTSRLGNRKGSGGKNQQGPGQGPGGMTIMQESVTNIEMREASEFNLLNIEAQLALQYYHRSFIFSFTPALAFPQTPSSITTPEGTFKEDLDSVFYWSAGISYWIRTGK